LGRPVRWPWDDIDEIVATRHLVDQTGCSLLLDLAQAATTARARDESLLSYVTRFPCERIYEIHIGPERDSTELGQECLDALHVLLRVGAVQAVTLEGAEKDCGLAVRCIEQLRDLTL